MKNLFIFMVSVTVFSNAYAITCMSADKNKQMIKAEVSANQVALTYEGNEYARLFLRDVKGDVRSYKSIGEFSHALTVKSNKSGTKAKLYQVSKGGTRLVMNMEVCK